MKILDTQGNDITDLVFPREIKGIYVLDSVIEITYHERDWHEELNDLDIIDCNDDRLRYGP